MTEVSSPSSRYLTETIVKKSKTISKLGLSFASSSTTTTTGTSNNVIILSKVTGIAKNQERFTGSQMQKRNTRQTQTARIHAESQAIAFSALYMAAMSIAVGANS